MARHFAFPIALGADGRIVTLEQDSTAEVAQSVALLLSTQPGERADVPDYGYTSPLGLGVDPNEVAAVIGEWEDRADPATVEVTLTTLTEQRAVVHPATPSSSTATATDGEG